MKFFVHIFASSHQNVLKFHISIYNKLNIIYHLVKTICLGKIWLWLYSRDQIPFFETVVFSAFLVCFYIMLVVMKKSEPLEIWRGCTVGKVIWRSKIIFKTFYFNPPKGGNPPFWPFLLQCNCLEILVMINLRKLYKEMIVHWLSIWLCSTLDWGGMIFS